MMRGTKKFLPKRQGNMAYLDFDEITALEILKVWGLLGGR